MVYERFLLFLFFHLYIVKALFITHPSQGEVVDVHDSFQIQWDLTNKDDIDLNATVKLTVYATENNWMTETLDTVPIAMHRFIWNHTLPPGDHYSVTLVDAQGTFSSGNFTITPPSTHSIPTIAPSPATTSTATTTQPTPPFTVTLTQTPGVATTTMPTSPFPSTASPPISNGLNNASKAGIGVGVAGAVIAISALGVFILRRRRQRQNQDNSAEDRVKDVQGQVDDTKAIPPPRYSAVSPVIAEVDSRPVSELPHGSIAYELQG